MSAPAREGPGMLKWLFGQLAHPVSRDRCVRCGAPGANGDVAEQLRVAGLAEASQLARLCDSCRRLARDEQLKRTV